MEKVKTYTQTEEGKEVLRYVGMTRPTGGMEVYKCWNCEDLFGSEYDVDDYEGKPECGLCQDELKQERRDSHGVE